MKKVLLSLCTMMCIAVFSANAQSVSSLGKAAKLSYKWLQDEGYKPQIDEDGDVRFKAEGLTFYIIDDDDENYLQVVLPGIKTIDTDDLASMLSALSECNDMTRDKKMVKAFVNEKGRVSLTTETYIDSTPIVGDYLETAIAFLKVSRQLFEEAYEEAYETLTE